METITYLLGAGASAGRLPTVVDMEANIINKIEEFKIQFNKFAAKNETNNKGLQEIVEDLEWLSDACSNHSSIDTFAKKLYIGDEQQEYNRLKRALSVYFTLAQRYPLNKNQNLAIDKRYDNFWASILDKDEDIPRNVRIISWNYDSQLELSYGAFFNNGVEKAYRKINMLSFHDNISSFKGDQFSIFKLNGSAKVSNDLGNKSHYFASEINGIDDTLFFKDLVSTYNVLKYTIPRGNAYRSQLSFAWEHDESTNDYYNLLHESIKETSVLVVIGYSFPFFNRKVDKKLINEFMPKLQKVYFQAQDAKDLKERFLSINNTIPEHELLLRFDLEQFVFPNELDL